VTASAVRVVANQAVMAAVAVAMAAVASAAKARLAKSALHARVDAVVKAESKAAKAKPVPHAVNVLSVVNAQSGLLASVRPAKAVVMVAAITEMKAEAKTAAMRSLS